MPNKVDEALEKAIKASAIVSRDRTLQTAHFKRLFRYDDDATSCQFDAETKVLWERLQGAARILRCRGGVTFDQLLVANNMTQSEGRQCIKVLINLGGEIEMRNCPEAGKFIFILHN